MNSNYKDILLASLLSLLVPATALIYTLNSHKEKSYNPPGAIKIHPGKLIIVNEGLFTENPRNNPLLAAETLNQKICILLAYTPEKKENLKSSSIETIAELLENTLGEDTKKTLDIIQRNKLAWNPNQKPWGVFTTPSTNGTPKKSNSEIPPFGAVKLNEGEAISRYTTEKLLNEALKLYWENKPQESEQAPNPFELTTFALKKNKINPEDIPTILATCEILEIRYDPKIKLFVSKKTKPLTEEWIRWTE